MIVRVHNIALRCMHCAVALNHVTQTLCEALEYTIQILESQLLKLELSLLCMLCHFEHGMSHGLA